MTSALVTSPVGLHENIFCEIATEENQTDSGGHVIWNISEDTF